MSISERVFNCIKAKGMSQKEFSEKTGIGQSTISGWKSKGLNPAADKILIISEVLEMDPYELLAGAGDGKYNHPEMIMVRKGGEEYSFYDRFFQLNAESRQRLLGYMDALKEMQ